MNVGTTIIKCRHSVRKYKDTPVEECVIRDALECAHLAPTAMNLQPWLFGTITDRELKGKIAALADNGKFIADAPVCFAIFGEKSAKYHLEDCCAATENLILALQSYGVGSCWVAGAKKDYAEPVRKLLNVPENYTLVSLVPAGIPSDIVLPQKKNIQAVTFCDVYGKEKD
ncbi:MAG TPA: nitroreductase family protein [Methanoregulaceae archaeon]|nr:nitroreductase family protein [Methanoregulaceae archaeon]